MIYLKILNKFQFTLAVIIPDQFFEIMNGLEEQSRKDIEYLNLHKISFIIALKFDRCLKLRQYNQQSYQQLQNQMLNLYLEINWMNQ
ncbi:unnamed protein product [Paramecium sonneborni]|uniref:Uncharacterized protein n=1 Tax=Paramecium sonneborni TaxID=65129 RepID=A0A8S1Q7Q9_9CILI|nr:unnamed protein product [Paramecium sonneborni]